MSGLSEIDLVSLVRSVFPGYPEDSTLSILVAIPRDTNSKTAASKTRQRMTNE